MFKKYMHIERYGTDEVENIAIDGCYIFPKIDGTNSSVWYDEKLRCASRKREITPENDNQGFAKYIHENRLIYSTFFSAHPHLRLFGEWLVEHSLKTYRDDAWRKFYVFDVMDDLTDRYLSYDEYKPMLDDFDIEYIPPLCIIKNCAVYESLLHELENNTYLIKDSAGMGEGIVIKNYDFVNKFGKTKWAKITTSDFKTKHAKEMGPIEKNLKQIVEQQIVDEYITEEFVNKIYYKIKNEHGEWKKEYIHKLLGVSFHELITEETWHFLKKYKNPVIDFKLLNQLTVAKVKKLLPELFE